jgi:CubicO group peptidase (beta-lactamase class C family)
MGQKWGEAYSFSGIVAVAENGRPIVVRAYGRANRDTGAVADADTRFRIGSVTKQFTAACVLQLAEQGKLRIEDSIRTYMPDYPAKTGDRVTLHELLSHTSGIPSYTDDDAFMNGRDKDHTPAQVLAAFKDKPLHFEPGSDWEYSNSNYFLLGLVIEKVSGQTYERYLQDHVLGAAGMTRTSTVDAPDAPDTAIGYDGDDSGDETLSRARAISMTVPFAAGALRSTVNDLLKWDRALAGTAVLSEASKARMFAPVRNEYGYGVGVDTVEGHVVESHGGGIDGFRSYFVRIPDAGLAVVVLCNSPVDPEPIGRALPPMLLAGKRTPPVREREPAEVTPRLVARVLGDYTMSVASKKDLEGKLPRTLVEDIARIQVSAEGTKLFARPDGQPRMRVFWGGGDLLFTKRGGVEIVLEGGANQPAKALVLTQGALTVRYERSV